jgi:hypothetical protein
MFDNYVLASLLGTLIIPIGKSNEMKEKIREEFYLQISVYSINYHYYFLNFYFNTNIISISLLLIMVLWDCALNIFDSWRKKSSLKTQDNILH